MNQHNKDGKSIAYNRQADKAHKMTKMLIKGAEYTLAEVIKSDRLMKGLVEEYPDFAKTRCLVWKDKDYGRRLGKIFMDVYKDDPIFGDIADSIAQDLGFGDRPKSQLIKDIEDFETRMEIAAEKSSTASVTHLNDLTNFDDTRIQ